MCVSATPYTRGYDYSVRTPPSPDATQRLPVNSSHGQLVTSQLVTHASHQKVNSSQAAQRKPYQSQFFICTLVRYDELPHRTN